MIVNRRVAVLGALATVLTVNCGEAKRMHSEAAMARTEAMMAALKQGRMTIPGLPREAVLGYPVPVVMGGGLTVAAPIFLRKGLPPAPPQLTAPGWIAYESADLAKFTYRQLDNDLTAPLGPHVMEPPLSMAEFRTAESRLYAAMDLLMPLAKDPKAGVPPELAGAAQTFVAIWRQIAHRPLAPHYRAINPDWFAMLGL